MSRGILFVFMFAMASVGPACNGSDTGTPTAPSTITSPVTLDWGTTLQARGYSSRSFETTQSGTAVVTLTSVAVPPTWEIGIGLGLPQANGGGCTLSTSVRAPAGSTPQLSIAVEKGVYCVAVYDPGSLTEGVGVMLHLVYP